MKKTLLSLLLLAAGVIAIACSSSDKDGKGIINEGTDTIESLIAAETAYPYLLPDNAENLNDIENARLEGLNDFSFNAIRQLSVQSGDDWVASPLSLAYALGMLSVGAGDAAAAEIMDALGFGNADRADIDNVLLKLTSILVNKYNDANVGLANAAIVKKGIELKKSFKEYLKGYYDANVVGLDFSNLKLLLEYINDWAKRKTEGMIDKVLDEDEISPDVILYLMNALYFKADWALPFVADFTVSSPFYNSMGNSVAAVQMMNQCSTFDYAETSSYQVVSLPLGDGGYEFSVLLPKAGHKTIEILDALTAESWRAALQSMGPSLVQLSIPQFDTNNTIDCKEPLKKLGIKTAFLPGSLTEIAKIPCYLSFCKQIARLKINEKGLEAAAVTIMGVAENAGPSEVQPIEFRADHPFLYILSEKSTGAILFAGKFSAGKPE